MSTCHSRRRSPARWPPRSVSRPCDGPSTCAPSRSTWRFEAEDEGTLVVLTLAYAVSPRWVRPITHEVTQWSLARQLRAHLAGVTAAAADPARVERARAGAEEG